MVQDPRKEKVTARVIFVGVMFGCINTDDHGNKRYEIGMIKCPKHSPQVWITKNGDAKPKQVKWPKGHDLIFKIVNAKEKGVRLYLPDDDPYKASFKFVLDVEEPRLHKGGITVNTSSFKGRIGVTDGLLYAHELTEDLNLKTWKDAADPGTTAGPFGEIARQVGLNIDCPVGKDNGIEIIDAATGKRLDCLPALPDVNYTIEVNNDCNRLTKAPEPRPDAARAARPPGSDFRFNYQVMRATDPKDKRKFDFELKLRPGARNPDVCNTSGGGRTKSIGFDWSKA